MSIEELPQGLEPPIDLGVDLQQYILWHGKTGLLRNGQETLGEAKVYFDFLPVPEFRVTFKPDNKPTLKDIFKHAYLGESILKCGPPIGEIRCNISKTGQEYSGYIETHDRKFTGSTLIRNATFLVINGPSTIGTPINRGNSSFAGRIAASYEGGEITVDRLSSENQRRRNIYEVTHVARFSFSDPVSFERVEQLSEVLFRTLSLMKCRWVGLLGPWIQTNDSDDSILRLTVTKTTRNGSSVSWCQESMRECFSELFPAMLASFTNEKRAEALLTALHWLVESEECAGGVEGSIILQQAALECLAWLEIVVEREICSESGFKPLPANDKIRWLLSLHNIQPAISNKCTAIKAYAKEFNLRDLIDVLVDVRNTMVHAEPKKSSRLFARKNGGEEQSDLWHQIGGILHQSFLAAINYRGLMLRRDLDVEFSVSAVKPVPWATS